MSWFLSEAAWRLIPPITSLICFIGFLAAMQLYGIAHYDVERHKTDDVSYRKVAYFLQRRALGRALALGLLTCSGILFGVGTLSLPIPSTDGVAILLWINHYVVGTAGTVLSGLALLDRRDRLEMW